MAFCVSLFAIYSNADNNENKDPISLTPGFPSQRQERSGKTQSTQNQLADGSEGTRGLKRSSEQVGNLKHGEGEGLIKRGAVRDFSSPYFEPYYAGVFTLGQFAELLTMIFCLSYFNKKVFKASFLT